MTTTADPRTLAPDASTWLTNSRVYNLIWLGRWIERAESIVRAIDGAAIAASESVGSAGPALSAAAEAWGVSVPDGEPPLPAIHSALRLSIERARDNAHQVAPLQFIQAVNALLERVESADPADESPQALRDFAARTLTDVAEASAVIERAWFNRQGLTDEELVQRFAQ